MRILTKALGLNGAFEREMADSVLAVMLGANGQLMDDLKGENKMNDILYELIEAKMPALMEIAIERARKEDIQKAVEALREFGHNDKEIKSCIMKKYSLPLEKADEFLQNTPIIHN